MWYHGKIIGIVLPRASLNKRINGCSLCDLTLYEYEYLLLLATLQLDYHS